ncbi:MAG: hypothetical protein FJ404_06660 [Verrucomicrobia bacterium]|nr:hypothetical protein [Verrucomicrobiota bacterium]
MMKVFSFLKSESRSRGRRVRATRCHRPWLALLLGFGCLGTRADAMAADAVYSGPQIGEKTTPFKVVEVLGENTGRERDPVMENKGAPTAWVFVHGIERSMVPLLRVIDQYGVERRSLLKTEIVFLAADRVDGERRVKAAASSLKLQGKVGLSLDGGEGPGNYGLNKECLMTVLAGKEDRVAANFALVQPGIADAPKILAALAAVAGDKAPPTVEQLTEKSMARSGAGRAPGAVMAGSQEKPKENFPGAVPTDAKLQGMLRNYIRPTQEAAAVDALLVEIKAYIKDSEDLKKQAIDGWTRVLHFGDRYGNEYSRKVGREFLEQLQRAPERKP